MYATQGFSHPADLRLQRDVVTVRDEEAKAGSTLDNLLGLEVLKYRLKNPMEEQAKAAGVDMEKDPNTKYALQYHFGVSAQELQKIYPDIVYEDGDGYLSVNYVEMVPLLLRSLQELSEEVDMLRKANMERAMQAGETTTGVGSRQAVSGAVLYQNTPNPFSASTEIRFQLPDDARDACIYIFDMAGKLQKQIPLDPFMQSVTINGYELTPGIYLYSLTVGGQEIDTKRMILSK